MRECKIVQDLLPNYIEKLTNEETNIFIEEHLSVCENCKNIFENMQTEIKVKKNNDREVKYIKKYSMRLDILEGILLMIIALFIIRIGRNAVIILNLSNKAKVYTTSSNYYQRTTNYIGSYLGEYENFYKDGKYFQNVIYGGIKVSMYPHGDTTNKYIESNAYGKTVELNSNDFIYNNGIINYIEIENPWKFIISCITARIRKTTLNGKECYYIEGLKTSCMVEDYINLYVDRETGLAIRTSYPCSTNVSGPNGEDNDVLLDAITDIKYEFDILTDDDFIEPDVSDYKVIENK